MDSLSDQQRAILDIERQFWTTVGAKDDAIRGIAHQAHTEGVSEAEIRHRLSLESELAEKLDTSRADDDIPWAARDLKGPSMGEQLEDKHIREAEAPDVVDPNAGEESQDPGA